MTTIQANGPDFLAKLARETGYDLNRLFDHVQ